MVKKWQSNFLEMFHSFFIDFYISALFNVGACSTVRARFAHAFDISFRMDSFVVRSLAITNDFIYVIVYFLFWFLKIFLHSFHKSSVCSSWICFLNQLLLEFFWLHTCFFFVMGVISAMISRTSSSLSMLDCSLKCFIASGCLLPFN